jgi:hypothetical protein
MPLELGQRHDAIGVRPLDQPAVVLAVKAAVAPDFQAAAVRERRQVSARSSVAHGERASYLGDGHRRLGRAARAEHKQQQMQQCPQLGPQRRSGDQDGVLFVG